MLEFTRKLGSDYKKSRSKFTCCSINPFNSERKTMSTLVLNNLDVNLTNQMNISFEKYIIFSKGASEIILKSCDRYLDFNRKAQALDENSLEKYSSIIEQYAENSLRTIGVCMKMASEDEAKNFNIDSIKIQDNKQMILLGVFGIEDPVRAEVPGAVKTCQRYN